MNLQQLNGRSVFAPKHQPRPWVSVLNAFATVAMLACTAVNLLVVLPAQRDIQINKRATDDELTRLNLLDAARKREIVNEAEFLRVQESNLDAARRLNIRLRGE